MTPFQEFLAKLTILLDQNQIYPTLKKDWCCSLVIWLDFENKVYYNKDVVDL